MKLRRYDNQTISQIEYFDFLINNLSIENLMHGHCTVGSDWRHYNIRSPFHRLYFVLKGEGELSRGTETVRLIPGRIYLISANSTWNYSCSSSLEQFFIHTRVLIMKGVDLFDSCRGCLILDFPGDETMEMIRKVESGTLESIISFKSKLYEIIAGFVGKYGIDVRANIERVKKYEELFSFIYANCSSDLQVADVVGYMNRSQSALYRDLKEDTGYSIKNYIDKTLISRAQEYLLMTDYSVKEIAGLLRFKDQYYFSRFFKKHTGMPPTRYKAYNKIEK